MRWTISEFSRCINTSNLSNWLMATWWGEIYISIWHIQLNLYIYNCFQSDGKKHPLVEKAVGLIKKTISVRIWMKTQNTRTSVNAWHSPNSHVYARLKNKSVRMKGPCIRCDDKRDFSHNRRKREDLSQHFLEHLRKNMTFHDDRNDGLKIVLLLCSRSFYFRGMLLFTESCVCPSGPPYI